MPELRPARQWLFRSVAMLLGTLAALLLVEAGARIRILLQPDWAAPRPRVAGGQLQLHHLVSTSTVPDLVYGLRPSMEGLFKGVPVRINEAGFRDPERSVEKPRGTRRIAVLGDSIAFGWGAPQEVRFTDRLERVLAELGPERWEVLNFGVPGYGSVQEAALLEHHVLAYEPDAIVVVVCHDNDASLPSFLLHQPPLWSVTRSFAWELISARRWRGTPAWEAWGLRASAGTEVPDELRHMVGWDNAFRALRKIAEVAAARGVPAMLVPDAYWFEEVPANDSGLPHDDDRARLVARAGALGFEVVDPGPELLSAIAPHQWHSLALWVTDTDPHGNALRHAIVGELLHERLANRGVLPPPGGRWDSIIREATTLVVNRDKLRPEPESSWRYSLDLAGGEAVRYLQTGWCGATSRGSYTCGDPAVLKFQLREPEALTIVLDLSPPHASTKLRAVLNGRHESPLEIADDAPFATLRFPTEAAFAGFNRLWLSSVLREADIGHPAPRLCGIGIRRLTFSAPVAQARIVLARKGQVRRTPRPGR